MTWQPVSGCGESCRSGPAETASRGATLMRLVTLTGVLLGSLVIVPLLGRRALPRVARALLAALGIRLRWRGAAPRPGTLLVANHVSWLDVVALLAVVPVRPVAKCEVRRWPGIGGLAGVTGAIFVDRSRPKTLPGTVREVSAALRDGWSVAAFPEGTTFCGATRGRFRPAMFQAAVDARAPVVPVFIGYDSTEPAFVGDDTLWSSVCRVARQRRTTVTLIAAPALRPADGTDRGALARAAQASVGLMPDTGALELAA